MTQSPTIHATAVLVGARAVLIRGAAGSGKSSLAFALIRAARTAPFRSRGWSATTACTSKPRMAACWCGRRRRSWA